MDWIWWAKVVSAVVMLAGLILHFKAPPHNPEADMRRMEAQNALVKKCLGLPGEIEMRLDRWGELESCTVTRKPMDSMFVK